MALKGAQLHSIMTVPDVDVLVFSPTIERRAGMLYVSVEYEQPGSVKLPNVRF